MNIVLPVRTRRARCRKKRHLVQPQQGERRMKMKERKKTEKKKVKRRHAVWYGRREWVAVGGCNARWAAVHFSEAVGRE